MRITFCGTGAAGYVPHRACSGVVVQAEDHTVMLDCGAGSVREAVRAGIQPRTIESVFISHLHHDHSVDLPVLLADRRFRRQPMPVIYGPPRITAFSAAARVLIESMYMPRHAASIESVEIDSGDEREASGFIVRSEETPHAPGVPAYARRFSVGGRTLVYSGDTQPNPKTLIPLSEAADVLLHEAFSEPGMERAMVNQPPEIIENLRNGYMRTHSEVHAVAEIAREAGVRRLVLTHLRATEDADEIKGIAASVFKGEIIVAYDGLVLDV